MPRARLRSHITRYNCKRFELLALQIVKITLYAHRYAHIVFFIGVCVCVVGRSVTSQSFRSTFHTIHIYKTHVQAEMLVLCVPDDGVYVHGSAFSIAKHRFLDK